MNVKIENTDELSKKELTYWKRKVHEVAYKNYNLAFNRLDGTISIDSKYMLYALCGTAAYIGYSNLNLPISHHLASNLAFLGNLVAFRGVYKIATQKLKYTFLSKAERLAIRIQACNDILDIEKLPSCFKDAYLKSYEDNVKNLSLFILKDADLLQKGNVCVAMINKRAIKTVHDFILNIKGETKITEDMVEPLKDLEEIMRLAFTQSQRKVKNKV